MIVRRTARTCLTGNARAQVKGALYETWIAHTQDMRRAARANVARSNSVVGIEASSLTSVRQPEIEASAEPPCRSPERFHATTAAKNRTFLGSSAFALGLGEASQAIKRAQRASSSAVGSFGGASRIRRREDTAGYERQARPNTRGLNRTMQMNDPMHFLAQQRRRAR